ncbi:MAG: UDP-3-O-(3-hydroxymyristoyl)glucosamine N-acyltransferase [Bdellovibrionota bacterium]
MWASSFANRWPSGIDSLIRDLKTSGLEVEADASAETHLFPWPDTEALRSSDAEDFGPSSWGYLGSSTRSPWPKAARFLFAHPSRAKDRPISFTGVVLWTPYPEAALDSIVRALWAHEWAGPTHAIPRGVVAEAGVVIGPDSTIGEGTILESGVRIGARVHIGKNCRIGAHSRIGDECVIGDGVLCSGFNSIGAQGFGLVDFPSVPNKRPRLHVGRAVIGNGVRLGAYVSVDRAVFGDTTIGDFTAIDNHTQIGHNSSVGQSSVILGFVAVSGSTHIGSRVTISGLTGTAGHLTIGDDVVIAAQSGVTADIPAGSQVKGYPVRPLREALKIASLQSRLPEIYDRLKALEDKIESSEDEHE